MTFISEDVTKQVNKYSFAQRCGLLLEINDSGSDDEDFEDFFEYGGEALTYAQIFADGGRLSEEEMDVVNDQFRLYILISNGWHL